MTRSFPSSFSVTEYYLVLALGVGTNLEEYVPTWAFGWTDRTAVRPDFLTQSKDEIEATGGEDLSFVVPILIFTCFIPGLPEKQRGKFVFQDLFEPVRGMAFNLYAFWGFFTLEKRFPYHQEPGKANMEASVTIYTI